MRNILVMMVVMALTACKEDVAQDVSALALTHESTGHFCQMNLLEHDGPKAQAHLAGLPGTPLFFSQVRDAVAYQRMPEQDHEILAIWVNDMGAAGATWAEPGQYNWIPAQDAIYVVGSRAVGGMGTPETVPFADSQKAQKFAELNGGEVLRLAEISDEFVLAPVVSDGDHDDADFAKRLRALSRNLGE